MVGKNVEGFFMSRIERVYKTCIAEEMDVFWWVG